MGTSQESHIKCFGRTRVKNTCRGKLLDESKELGGTEIERPCEDLGFIMKALGNH